MKISRPKQSIRACLLLTSAWVVALAGIITLMPVVSAQSGGRLRVVVRTPAGSGIAGIVVRVDREALDQSVAETGFANGTTDQRGVVDFDSASPRPWPVGGYQLRFLSGTSKRPLMSTASQDISYPPLAIEIRSSHDDWAMFVLDYQGDLLPDYSLSLLAPPQLHAPEFPTPAPVTINQALAARGLATVGPPAIQPTPGGPVATVAPDLPTSPAATTPDRGQDGSSLLLWLTLGLALAGIYLLRGRIGHVIGSWLAQPQQGERSKRKQSTKRTGRRTR
ncbi:MAG: hypothetical protein DLM69_02620 [Candidatus Chloroheliales bacterium]|nr:MAG: hypothetical protein DLM69_02620 [Chloroflexota bacterium]